jgi:2-(1,2-epoxy-1,2-dihydrophenyl)acetyl-CoA isomerase
LDLEIKDGVAHIVLDRPDEGNPFTAALCREWCAIANEIADDPRVRAVLLKGRGKYFSVGGDIESFANHADALPQLIREWVAAVHAGMARLARMDAPIVAAVHATAVGAGLALVASCDLVYCARSARLGSAFTQIGYSCDSGLSAALAARMGVARARRFVLLAEMLAAEQAAEVGLVDFVIADDEVWPEAERAALRLAQGPTRAYGEVRRLFQSSLAQPFATQLEDEALAIVRVAGTEDAREGIRAFVERRRPVFRGC